MGRVMMMFHSWMSPDGVQMTPGLVDRDTYPEIPDECFWKQTTYNATGCRPMAELLLLARAEKAEADNTRLRALIKAAEWSNHRQGGAECPWCESDRLDCNPHGVDCPAFTPSGEVK